MTRLIYKRSRKDYPQGVIGIYDNAGQSNESGDHIMVVFEPVTVSDPRDLPGHRAERATFPILTMSDAPFWPQGICISGEVPFRPTGGWQAGPSSAGKTIDFAALNDDQQRAVYSHLVPLCSVCYEADGQHAPECTATTPYTVGITSERAGELGRNLARFETHDAAALYIATLPDHKSGKYYLDGPEEPVYVWRVYCHEGPNAEGKNWLREFGEDYPTRDKAREVAASYSDYWLNHRYTIRRAKPRYVQAAS